MNDTMLNSQIVQSVVDVNGINNLMAPSHSVAMLETVMAETLGMAMHNAVSRQQGAGMIGSASVAAVCAKLVGAPFGRFAPPPIPDPPHVDPLPPLPPDPSTPAGIIAGASVDAAEAVDLLRAEAAVDQPYASMAKAMLTEIAAEATKPVPPPINPSVGTLEEVFSEASQANQAVMRLAAEAAPGQPNAAVALAVLQAIAADASAEASPAPSSGTAKSAAPTAATVSGDPLDAIMADSVTATDKIARLKADASGPYADVALTALQAIGARAKAGPVPAPVPGPATPTPSSAASTASVRAGARAKSRKPSGKP